ncbi:MAG: amidase [Caldilineaceae bacterium]|nr:amidase [Caldilineaceae bacterium]
MYATPFPLAQSTADLRSDEQSLLAHIHAICDRVDWAEPHIHAFLPEPHRRARLVEEAVDLIGRYPDPENRPPLFGALVGVKDIFRVDGFYTQAGSELPKELFEGDEAAVVTRLRDAGALIAGKTVTTEFAYFQPGPTRNPHNVNHTPGGSSSGSAAGVAAGFFPLALGTQTIGSVIRPAAFCGIVGFKPSYDRIPTDGLLFFSKSLDHVGLFTQDLSGMVLAASLLCDGWDAGVTVPDRGPVLAVPEGPYLAKAWPEGLDSFWERVSKLEKAGAQIVTVPFFEEFDELDEQHRRMMAAEAAQVHAEWYAKYEHLYSEHMQEIMWTAGTVDAAELAQAQAARFSLRGQMAEALGAAGADLWVAPPAQGAAPEGIHATGNPVMNLPWTNAGVPALNLPVERTRGGLPMGLQLVGRFGEDEQVLAWAGKVEGMLE